MLARDRLVLVMVVALAGCRYTPPETGGVDADVVDPATVSFVQPTTNADEVSGVVNLSLVLSKATTGDVTVNFTFGGTATIVDDFTASTSTVIPAGQTTHEFAVTIVQDANMTEMTETIDVMITSVSGAAIGAQTTHAISIADRILPRARFAMAATSTPESTQTMLVVELNAPSLGMSTVEIGIAGTSTATGGQDASLTTGTVVTFADQQMSAMVPVGEINDTLDEEDNEVFDLVLQNPSMNLILSPTNTTATHTIADNDASPDVGFEIVSQSSPEATATVDVVISLSTISGRNVTVDYSLGASTAAVPDDATLNPAPGTLLIPAGQLSVTITVTVDPDLLDEANEILGLTATGATNANLVGSTHQLTIMDDDLPPTISFMAASGSVQEAETTVDGMLVLSAPSGRVITAPFTLSGSANVPADYSSLSGTSVVFPPGVTMMPVTLDINNDNIDEPDETAVVTLGVVVNATKVVPEVFTLTITDDNDAPSEVQFDPTEADGSAAEGDAGSPTFDYELVLDKPSGFTVTVPIVFTGDAVTPSDFSSNPVAAPPAAPVAQVVFPPGSVSQIIRLTIVTDNVGEPGNEDTIIMTIDSVNVLNATVNMAAVDERRHVIVDDD